MIEFSKRFDKKGAEKTYTQLAKKCKSSFIEQFYIKRKKSLYDVIGDSKVRPNQLFALSLTYPVIDANSEIAENIINTVEKKLLNNYGLKTLASKEEGYVDVYEGGEQKRDSSYHQGITWPWLLGLYYDALKNMKEAVKTKKAKTELEEKIQNFREKVQKTFKKEIKERGCVGSIAEIYDSKRPQLPNGTIAQAWSVAEVFRIILGK